MTNAELSWCAGFIDGDGYFDADARTVTVTQVVLPPLLRLQRALGGKVTGPYQHKNPNAAPCHRWHSAGADSAWLLENVVPLMTPGIKQDQAIARLGRPRLPRVRIRPEGCPKGHAYDDDNAFIDAAGKLRCRQCGKDYRNRQ